MDDQSIRHLPIQQLRSFNRTVTARIGALDDEYLARGRPLGASRVLWEIGAGGTDVRTLRTRLDLDSGYLSRLLRSLEQEGLIEVVTPPTDGRVRVARRTAAGQAEAAELDRLSDAVAWAMLEPLDESRRQQLIDAAATVERLLTAGMVEIAVEPAGSADARFCIESYYRELDQRFDAGFDPALSRYGDVAEYAEPSGLLMLARLRGEPIGCGALKFDDGPVVEIKRMWIAPSARGLGVGGRLLAELEEQARRRGASTVRLDTNRNLTEAIALYHSAGYVEIPAFNDERYATHWFEKQLSGAV
jgi:DNA-binding MarR family transcriptional regulator/N-acetylglutamate synthase-like GNAT family acetyltransferase